jgi:non-canonical poly(A) RNA polymerase PAPD5/7
VQVFGSNATSLFLPHSDIDLVVYFNNTNDKNGDDSNTINQVEVSDGTPSKKKPLTASQQERIDMENWSLHDRIVSQRNKSHYTMLAEALQNEWGTAKLSYLEVIENTRVPLVKFTHRPSNISVDVCFNQEGGPEAAAMMNQWLKDLPPLRPLCLLLKYFLSCRGLNETYIGGIGSYALQLMIISFLQHRAREESNIRRSTLVAPENSGNLGSMLLEFFELYGLDFNYITTGISLRHGGYYFPKGARDKKPIFWLPSRPFSVAIENPRDPLHDVGKGSYRMIQIQKTFDIAFRTILAYTSEPIVPTQSILATIIPPTKDMVKRSVWLGLPHSVEERYEHDQSKRNNKRRREGDDDLRRTSSSSDEDVNYRMKRRDNAGGNHQRTIYPSLLKSRKGYHV